MKRCFSSAASVVGKVQAFPAASAGANEPGDEDDDWDLEGTMGLDHVKCASAKCHLHDSKDV